MKIYPTLLLLLCLAATQLPNAQQPAREVLPLTLHDAVQLAKAQSLWAFKHKNTYLTRYWAYRSYKAQRLPSLRLTATPVSYDRSVQQRYDSETNTDVFIPNESLSTSAGVAIEQNLFFTGGTLSLLSDFRRLQNFRNSYTSYASTPVSLRLNQPLNGYNRFRWESRIEPLRFEQAQKEWMENMEAIAMQVVDEFFGLAQAEINLKIAHTNLDNADTLFTIGRGRFNMGTITQNDLLDMELSLLNANLEVKRAALALEQHKASFNSFLGIDKEIAVQCILPDRLPLTLVEVDQAVAYALEQNSAILDQQRQLLEANRRVAQQRASGGISADLRANLGYDKNTPEWNDLYQAPFGDQRGVALSFQIPVVDWGQRRGQMQMARSERNVAEASVNQARIDFEQRVLIQVMEFNMQKEVMEIVAKADTVAQLGYNVTKQRFIIGKVDIIKLNTARNAQDAARRNFIGSLANYWSAYYNLRRLTLFNFEQNQPLRQEFDLLLEQ